MLVKNWMSKTVITADVDDSMNEVMNLMKEHEIGMVPVMKKGKLVGIVTVSYTHLTLPTIYSV